MSPRVGSPSPKSLSMRPAEQSPVKTPVGDGVKRTPVPDLSFELPKKKPVNMTGRHKPVTRAPVPVKEHLASDVSKARAAVAAGSTSTSPKSPLERVQKMTTAQLAQCVAQMHAGKIADPALKLAVASEIAARTTWGRENPEAVGMMRELIKQGKLGFEQVDPQLSASPEALVQRVAEHAQIEYDDASARVAKAATSGANPRGAAKILHTDGSLSPRAPYDKLPSDLKSKLPETVWRDLGQLDRKTLMSSYARLKGWGVWDQVKSVKGQLNPAEAHAHVGGKEFEVAGNTGGVVFEAKNARAFKEALIATGHFGVDKGIVGALHQGQDSTREWTDDPGSLHVSIGPGDQFDTHMDKYSPVKKPKNGETQIDPGKGFDHHRNEVWPEMFRNVLGVPGAIVDVSTRRNPDGGLPEVRGTVSLELRGPVKREKPTVDRKTLDRINQAPSQGDPGPDGVIGAAVKNVDLSKVKFPLPAGMNKGDLDPQVLAEHLAASMLEAARSGKDPIHLDLVDFAGAVKLQPEMSRQLQALGKQVYAELKKALAKLPEDQRALYDLKKLQSLKVTYGVKSQGARVRINE